MSRRRWISVAQVLGSAGLILYLLHVFGPGAFADALNALTVWSAAAALLLGLTATAAQAARWRIISGGYGMVLPRRSALYQCYEATFLNSVLPGGLAGDAVRTVRQRSAHSSTWGSSIGSVLGERLALTVVVLLAAAAALVPVDWRIAAATAAGAALVLAAARRSLRGLPASARAAIWALSLLGWSSFAAMFVIAAALITPEVPASDVVPLAALCLAGMSIPLNVGGWGPREGVTALAFMAYGYSGADGVAASAGYGLLALISVTPGAALLLALAWRHRRRRDQLSADSTVT